MTAIYREDNKTVIYPRKLHERSFLLFEYQGAKGRIDRAHMPFLQNVSISESGKARLANYSLLGRAGELFAYTGAEARKISIDFELNLQHLFHLLETEGFSNRFKSVLRSTDLKTDKQAFLKPSQGGPSPGYPYANASFKNFLNLVGEDALRELESKLVSDNKRYFGITRINGYGLPENPANPLIPAKKLPETVSTGINLAMYWINLIRSSVLNNSKNTVFGPPIVRLNHGPMYMNSPCLVESYKISVDKESTYSLETLFPYTIKLSMTLLESRTGDFGDYKNGDLIQGDNLAGWEAVLDKNVLDSMNYGFEEYGSGVSPNPTTPDPGGRFT